MDYEIIYSSRKTLCLQIKKNSQIVVRSPYKASKLQIEDFVNSHINWIEKKQSLLKDRLKSIDELDEQEILELKTKALEYIPSRVKLFADIMSVEPKKISINRAKTRFGSCSNKGTLNFSCNLMRYPLEAIDYVIVHELAHMKELNHSKKFWSIVEKYMPDYKERKKLLKRR